MTSFLGLEKKEIYWEIFWISLSLGIFCIYQTFCDKAV